jgi:hypothetical protein
VEIVLDELIDQLRNAGAVGSARNECGDLLERVDGIPDRHFALAVFE